MSTTLTDQWGDFTAIPNEFIDSCAEMSLSARWLFITLRRYTHSRRKCAFPSYEHLREVTGMSNQTIAKAVRELEGAGWLSRVKRFGQAVQYTLLRPAQSSENQSDDSPLKSREQSSKKQSNSPLKNRDYIDREKKTDTHKEQRVREGEKESQSQPRPDNIWSAPSKKAHRFVYKACKWWDDENGEPMPVGPLDYQSVNTVADWLKNRVEQAGHPDLFREWWFKVMGREGQINPNSIPKSWHQFIAWKEGRKAA